MHGQPHIRFTIIRLTRTLLPCPRPLSGDYGRLIRTSKCGRSLQQVMQGYSVPKVINDFADGYNANKSFAWSGPHIIQSKPCNIISPTQPYVIHKHNATHTLWVTLYLQLKSTFGLMMDYVIRNYVTVLYEYIFVLDWRNGNNVLVKPSLHNNILTAANY